MSRFNKTTLTYRVLDAFEERYDTSIYDDHDIDLIEHWAYMACMEADKNTTLNHQLDRIVNGLKKYGHRTTVNANEAIQKVSHSKKYELTDKIRHFWGHTLHQIAALKEFTLRDGSTVYEGDIGGWIESEENLSQDGTCWIDPTSKVFDVSKIEDDAYIHEYSSISKGSIIFGEADIEDSEIEESSVCDCAYVYRTEMIGSRCRYRPTISECKVFNSVIDSRANLVKCEINNSTVNILAPDEYSFNITNLTVQGSHR